VTAGTSCPTAPSAIDELTESSPRSKMPVVPPLWITLLIMLRYPVTAW
jgi:hypothetical protein